MEADKAKGNISGHKRKAEPTYDINTQVVVSIAGSTTGSNGADAGMGGAAAAAAGAGSAGGVGAARGNGLPPALARSLPGAQQVRQTHIRICCYTCLLGLQWVCLGQRSMAMISCPVAPGAFC
jgi:hypothetical protein